MKNIIIGIITLVTLNSCATIIGGNSYYAHVRVEDHPKAKIYLNGQYLGDGNSTTAIRRKNANQVHFKLREDGYEDQSINKPRFVAFCKKGSTSYNAISPDSLPPTSNAAMYHSLRVYHQVQTWLLNDLPPLKWGYIKLLKMFRCSCKGGCKNSRCTCVRHGLKCTMICRECNGVSCKNTQIPNSDLLLLE